MEDDRAAAMMLLEDRLGDAYAAAQAAGMTNVAVRLAGIIDEVGATR